MCKVNKTGAQLGVGYKYNDSYLVIFSKDASKEQNQLDIETVYDMINQKGIQLTEENKNIFEYMFLSKKKVAVAVVLQYLNDINLNITEDGVYLVSYFADGSVTDNDFSISLYQNGSALTGETITVTDTDGAVSKTILVNASAGDTLAIYNSATSQATLDGASITALKLA